MKKTALLLFLGFITIANLCFAQTNSIAKLANDFLGTLDAKLKLKAAYTYDDKERFNWNFVPRERTGVSLHDLTPKQKEAGMSLLKASLSLQGFDKATGIVSLEAILREVEGREANDTYRDPLNYYFTIFGSPSESKIWGWRFEGHHLALNFSSMDGILVASTPTFMGANPATVPTGDKKGLQTLKLETEVGFELINSLTNEQLKIARFSEEALPEIVSGNSRKAERLKPNGISYSSLTPAQKLIFDRLLKVFVKNYQLGFSDKLMEKIIRAGIENLSFAWSGSLQPGTGHYYRIQGPMLLIEYDNTQTKANHVHTAVRDLTNDFAEDILKEHYDRDHK